MIRSLIRRLARPRAKLPLRRVDVACAECGCALYKYAKGNGAGSRLVKMYVSRIVIGWTKREKPTVCPDCGSEFARDVTIKGERALKIISGKVTVS